MSNSGPVLYLLCGKIASGKSTAAVEISRATGAIVIAEDTWLKTLFGGLMTTGGDYVRFSGLLRNAMAPHIAALLRGGVSVVLDFAANTLKQRAWMREILAKTGASHELHYLDVADDVCLARLRARNAEGKHAFAATEEQFHAFARHFAPPMPDEGFNVIRR